VPNLSDLVEIKTALEIDLNNHTEDSKILLFLEWASEWIAEYLNRPGLLFKSRTEYYNGTGTPNLLLRSRPVHTTPTIQVWTDTDGHFGSSSGAFSGDVLVYGTDFYLKIDQDDGTSRSGILVRSRGWTWEKRWARDTNWLSTYVAPLYGGIKVTYSGGYTLNNMPAQLRMAVVMLVTRMRYLMPLGMEIGSESYEERNISIVADRKQYLMGLVLPMLSTLRNWNF
jgi:hypothetical protein